MRINDKEKENGALVDCINLLEQVLIDNQCVLDESQEDVIKALKIKAGLLLDAEIKSLGLRDGFYVFELARSDGKSKFFYCNPDDSVFYNICIPQAIEMDKNPAMRKRRLDEYNAKSETKSVGSCVKSLEDAISNIGTESNTSGLRINRH